ncbi:MAG: polyhydroxyalkanoate synthesis repressor PhaR [Rhodospirillales bacterium]|nr:polyhydroxyalkanoate synthesis repressor PhaR [Rhodospirillales bacterium]
MAEQSAPKTPPVTIKKYANRRLYNTATSSYVTLDHLAKMVKGGTEFVVFDAKTGDDITRAVLTHIIVEEESKGGQNLLPIGFLRHLISFYGDSLQSVVPRYLEYTMHAFARNQESMRDYMRGAFGGLNPFTPFEELGKRNMVIFESAMKMFTPFYPNEDRNAADKQPGGTDSDAGEQIDKLREKLDRIQKELDDIKKDGRK